MRPHARVASSCPWKFSATLRNSIKYLISATSHYSHIEELLGKLEHDDDINDYEDNDLTSPPPTFPEWGAVGVSHLCIGGVPHFVMKRAEGQELFETL